MSRESQLLSLSGVLAVPPDMRVRPLRPDEEEAPVVGRGRRRVHTGRGEQALHGKHLSLHGGLTLSFLNEVFSSLVGGMVFIIKSSLKFVIKGSFRQQLPGLSYALLRNISILVCRKPLHKIE